MLRGEAEPVPLHRVLRESRVMSRIDVTARRGLTLHGGRELEVALLLERWAIFENNFTYGAGYVISRGTLQRAPTGRTEQRGAEMLFRKAPGGWQQSAWVR